MGLRHKIYVVLCCGLAVVSPTWRSGRTGMTGYARTSRPRASSGPGRIAGRA